MLKEKILLNLFILYSIQYITVEFISPLYQLPSLGEVSNTTRYKIYKLIQTSGAVLPVGPGTSTCQSGHLNPLVRALPPASPSTSSRQFWPFDPIVRVFPPGSPGTSTRQSRPFHPLVRALRAASHLVVLALPPSSLDTSTHQSGHFHLLVLTPQPASPGTNLVHINLCL